MKISLSHKDAEVFFNAIINPPSVNFDLEKAAEFYRKSTDFKVDQDLKEAAGMLMAKYIMEKGKEDDFIKFCLEEYQKRLQDKENKKDKSFLQLEKIVNIIEKFNKEKSKDTVIWKNQLEDLLTYRRGKSKY